MKAGPDIFKKNEVNRSCRPPPKSGSPEQGVSQTIEAVPCGPPHSGKLPKRASDSRKRISPEGLDGCRHHRSNCSIRSRACVQRRSADARFFPEIEEVAPG
jgi:hypothetical protein